MTDATLTWASCPWCGMDNVFVMDGALIGHSKTASYDDVVIAARLGVPDALMCDGGGFPFAEDHERSDGHDGY